MFKVDTDTVLDLQAAKSGIFSSKQIVVSEDKKYNLIVFILRAQPLHMAHVRTIKKAAELARNVLLILGSANEPSTFKNPFSTLERREMLQTTIDALTCKEYSSDICIPSLPPECNYIIESVENSLYNDNIWAKKVQALVDVNSIKEDKIGIIGCDKDSSSFYLKMFPQWERIEVPLLEQLSATDIRDIYFKENHNLNFLKSVVPYPVLQYLEWYASTEAFASIVAERKFVEKYKKQFASLPYPPIFVTTDAVVLCAGHVLMIKRKDYPGKGLWALPGGFVNANTDKTILDAAIRELKEETNIKIPKPVLIGSITNTHVFDAIDRSSRGRTITHAFFIELSDTELPKIKGGDDAESAAWIPIGQLNKAECYEDHYEIQQYFVGA